MCEDQEDSFMDKNSIAEFELLEKECFTEDTSHTQKSTAMVKGTKAKKQVGNFDSKIKEQKGKKTVDFNNVQIIHDSPVKKTATEIISNLKSAHSDKNSDTLDEGRIDKLEL